MGGLSLSTALIAELVIKKISQSKFRAIFVVIICIALFLTWAELALGIFGTPFAGN